MNDDGHHYRRNGDESVLGEFRLVGTVFTVS